MPADPHRRERDPVIVPPADCHELLEALRAIAERRTIPLGEISELNSEVARLTSKARLQDPEYLRRQELGASIARDRRASRPAVG